MTDILLGLILLALVLIMCAIGRVARLTGELVEILDDATRDDAEPASDGVAGE